MPRPPRPSNPPRPNASARAAAPVIHWVLAGLAALAAALASDPARAAGATAAAAQGFAAVGAPAATPSPASDPPRAPSETGGLYHALGRHAVLVPLMDDFVERCAADARIGAFFAETNLTELKKQLVDQLCQVADGPCTYEGASMADAHADMRVGRADFLAMVELLQQSMDRAGIAFALQRRLLARLAPMHRDIVTPH